MHKEILTRSGNKLQVELISNDSMGEFPKTVYKYRNWGNDLHKTILTSNHIYIPSPKTFNDPFDCRIPVAYHLMLEDKEMARQFVTNYVERNHATKPEEFKSSLIQSTLNSPEFNDPNMVRNGSLLSIDYIISKVGVFSCSPINDNILMWSHYADCHRGFCVGFETEGLIPFFYTWSFVDYRAEYPIILPNASQEEKMIRQISEKSQDWDYEMEYRLTTPLHVNSSVKLPENVIKEVILGHSMSRAHREEILCVIKNNLPNIIVYQATTNATKFKLDIFVI